MKIYLVNNGGEYSDYGILAIFTDRAVADRFAATVGSTDLVEEWDCDLPEDKWVWWEAYVRREGMNGNWTTPTVSYSKMDRPHESAPEGWVNRFPLSETAVGYGLTREEARKAAEAKLFEINLPS